MTFQSKPRHAVFLAGLLLAVLTIAVFYTVKDHDFVNFDDNQYVTENYHVQAGLTWENVRWAFTTMDLSNWHPLTWLSHMLDCQLYGLNPMGPHMNNLLLHLGNVLLLFLLLNYMTGALWRSFFVAALFAVHPLHVESVAWVAERKDVLSTFFGLLSMWAYARYVKRSSKGNYGLSLFFYGLCLMSKPMLVTLPLILLLLDYWPLARFKFEWPKRDILKSPLFFSVREKIPFFAFSAASSVVTLWAQTAGGSVATTTALPLKFRIANTLISYVRYLGKMLWPHDLAVFYPYPGISIRLWTSLLAGFTLFIITVAVIRLERRHPYLAMGWLWYLLTLLPVIGLVQVGMQAMADRYTYVPLIGPFIMLAWGIPGLVPEWHCKRVLLGAAGGLVILVMAGCTWVQLQNWQNSATLFEHALKVTRNNYLAHCNLGQALSLQGKTEQAIRQYEEALRINPGHAFSHNNLGLALAEQGKFKEAMAHFKEAIRLRPRFFEAYSNMGLALARQKRYTEAIADYRKALQINPEFYDARDNLGIALSAQGRLEEAIAQFRILVQARPNSVSGHVNLGSTLVLYGKPAEAVPHLRKALELRPRLPQAHFSLGMAFLAMGERNSALTQVEILKSMDPPLAKRLLRSVERRAGPPP